MAKVAVSVHKTQYGMIVLDIPEDKADEYIGEDLSVRTRKLRVLDLAIETYKNGAEITWFDYDDVQPTFDFGYMVMDENAL